MKKEQKTINEILEQSSHISNTSPQYLFLKRLFDFAGSLLAILLLSPVFFITSVWIKFRLHEAVLSMEAKYGLKGMIFYTFEFSVKNATIRKLPLLFNILKGDMSFIGPQPASAEDLTYVTWYNLRLSAKPGITGLWQVSGRTGGVGEMVRMDLKYIRERSFRFDMKILLTAIFYVCVKRSRERKTTI